MSTSLGSESRTLSMKKKREDTQRSLKKKVEANLDRSEKAQGVTQVILKRAERKSETDTWGVEELQDQLRTQMGCAASRRAEASDHPCRADQPNLNPSR